MTILNWPGKTRQTRTPRKRIVDPLPEFVLNAILADLPGPKGETETERATRFEAQRAELLRHKPRDAAEAMLAAHAMMLRMVAQETMREPGSDPVAASRARDDAKQFEKMAADIARLLIMRQRLPRPKPDPVIAENLGLGAFLIPDPNDPPVKKTASAVIVNLHPAPKMLQ